MQLAQRPMLHGAAGVPIPAEQFYILLRMRAAYSPG